MMIYSFTIPSIQLHVRINKYQYSNNNERTNERGNRPLIDFAAREIRNINVFPTDTVVVVVVLFFSKKKKTETNKTLK